MPWPRGARRGDFLPLSQSRQRYITTVFISTTRLRFPNRLTTPSHRSAAAPRADALAQRAKPVGMNYPFVLQCAKPTWEASRIPRAIAACRDIEQSLARPRMCQLIDLGNGARCAMTAGDMVFCFQGGTVTTYYARSRHKADGGGKELGRVLLGHKRRTVDVVDGAQTLR